MRTLRLRRETKIIPIHQLSDLQLWDLSAITGVVCIDQTVLKTLLSDEMSLIINTKDLILRLNPALQTSAG